MPAHRHRHRQRGAGLTEILQGLTRDRNAAAAARVEADRKRDADPKYQAMQAARRELDATDQSPLPWDPGFEGAATRLKAAQDKYADAKTSYEHPDWEPSDQWIEFAKQRGHTDDYETARNMLTYADGPNIFNPDDKSHTVLKGRFRNQSGFFGADTFDTAFKDDTVQKVIQGTALALGMIGTGGALGLGTGALIGGIATASAADVAALGVAAAAIGTGQGVQALAASKDPAEWQAAGVHAEDLYNAKRRHHPDWPVFSETAVGKRIAEGERAAKAEDDAKIDARLREHGIEPAPEEPEPPAPTPAAPTPGQPEPAAPAPANPNGAPAGYENDPEWLEYQRQYGQQAAPAAAAPMGGSGRRHCGAGLAPRFPICWTSSAMCGSGGGHARFIGTGM